MTARALRRSGSLAAALALAAVACGAPTIAATDPAGRHEDSAGLLAQASTRLMTAPDAGVELALIGGDSYGGAAYGGQYGGGAYSGPAPASWSYVAAMRSHRYEPVENLHGVVEGTVTWTGALPARVATACGSIDDPSVRVGGARGVGGVIVYIEQVAFGRPTPMFARPVTVGGSIVKHGCALYPAAQVVAPLPARLEIHGDGARALLQIQTPAGQRSQAELQEGGVVRLEALPGVTRVDAPDRSLAAAWVIAIDSPYYAITDDGGHFRIDELPVGTYELTFWQAPLAHVKDGAITYGEPVIERRTIKIELGKPTKLAVALPRS